MSIFNYLCFFNINFCLAPLLTYFWCDWFHVIGCFICVKDDSMSWSNLFACIHKTGPFQHANTKLSITLERLLYRLNEALQINSIMFVG